MNTFPWHAVLLHKDICPFPKMVKLAAKLNNLLVLQPTSSGVLLSMLLTMSDWRPQQDLFLNTNAAQKEYEKLMNERKGMMYEAPKEDPADIGWISGFVMGFPQNFGQKSVHANGN